MTAADNDEQSYLEEHRRKYAKPMGEPWHESRDPTKRADGAHRPHGGSGRYLKMMQPHNHRQIVRSAKGAGRPFGSEAFFQKLERLARRQMRPKAGTLADETMCEIRIGIYSNR
jgi:hypothetical protein